MGLEKIKKITDREEYGKLPLNLWLGHCNWGYRPDFILIATLTGQEQVEEFDGRSEVWTDTAANMISKRL